MTKSLEETLAGADFEGGEVFCDDLYNNLKNHWRANYGGDPCGSAALDYPQPGMLISDAYDDKLYHVTLATGCPCSEIVQTCVPVSDDVPVYFGDEFDGAIYYDELTNNELVLEAKNAANVEGVTVNLLETNQKFRIRQNADFLAFYHNGTDGYIETNTGGGGLRFENSNPQDITFWEAIASGNPNFRIHGWIGAARRYSQFRMDDTNGEFEIESEDNASHEGITVLIQEANQKFRVRGAARALRFYVKSDGEIGTNQTEASGVSAGYTPGTISHRLPLYDENQALVGYIALYDALT